MAQESEMAATQPVKVDVGSVEAQLADMWRYAIGGCIPEAAAPATRAILSNLLIYAASHAEAKEAMEVVTQIIGDHPARTIVADAEDAEPEQQADVAMLCSITEHGRRLCGEEIQIHPHAMKDAAVSMILPILVPELPVYLWTPGDLVWDEQIAHQLIRICDHWIFDSRRFTNRSERFTSVAALGPGKQPPVAVHDLAWASLTQWREAVAQHFDPQPARNYLRGVVSVDIGYSGREGNQLSIEPILMACWLMCRLQWRQSGTERSNGTWTIAAEANGRDVLLRLNPTPEAQSPIVEVRIEAEIEGKRGVFKSWLSSPQELSLEANAPDLPATRRTIRIAQPQTSDELRQTLDTTGADRAYEQMIPALRTLSADIDKQVNV